ncbi:hypothetical protein [Bradyrhizobium sp. CCBAU 11357]|uniref:hypothetical protein n=1 Tax=Bradyrhizobium sp. CCBAU 11357 TaxID=1630808 RepID=UPI00230245C1|nr:hypothetical protein [Bradyrhizobium sp. CCBAU 11357]MDA9500519.1 hypothetical protein [Bradyrhizobium sp. CCBAU 11357]
MPKAKSLKDQNRWQLWLAIVANAVAFYLLMQWDAITIDGVKTLITKAANILPLGLAIVVVTVINGQLSADMKARIVFLRWRHALPGHRAFSDLAPKDPRIDMDRLKKVCGNKLPDDPDQQNKVWYGLYKPLQNQPSIEHVQRDFLLMRDYACFVALATIGFGLAAFVELTSVQVASWYVGAMIGQFLVVRQAAANYGSRFVTTVMAEKAASTHAPRPRVKAATG